MLAGDETLALSSPVPHATIITPHPLSGPGRLPASTVSHFSGTLGRLGASSGQETWDVGCGMPSYPVPALAATRSRLARHERNEQLEMEREGSDYSIGSA